MSDGKELPEISMGTISSALSIKFFIFNIFLLLLRKSQCHEQALSTASPMQPLVQVLHLGSDVRRMPALPALLLKADPDNKQARCATLQGQAAMGRLSFFFVYCPLRSTEHLKRLVCCRANVEGTIFLLRN